MRSTRPRPPGAPRVHASVVHMLAAVAASRPDAPALRFEDTRLDYRGFATAVAALAQQWRALIGPGARIALILPNSLDLAIATYAAHALRAQVVALNPAYSARELAYMLADAAPALIVADVALTHDVGALYPALALERLIRIEAGTAYAALAQSDRDRLAPLDADGPCHDDLATLQYTGGTTGKPKGVNITHRQLAHNLAQREALLPTMYGAEVVLCTMPLFHVSAVAMCLHLACYAASELIIHRRFDATAMLAAIAAHRVTLISAAPTIYHSLVLHPLLGVTDLRSLRSCYSGAAPLPEATLKKWEEIAGCPILEGYGMSEAGPCLTYNPARGPRKLGSVGVPVPDSVLQVVDASDPERLLPAGTPGEIRVRGPHTMAGYRNLPDQTAATLRDGWVYTGDVAVIDSDGYVFIRGRKHDTINVGGFKVYPREVEDVLLAHADVVEAAAFAAPHAHYGEVVHAWIVARDGAAPRVEDLLEHCCGQLVRYKVPAAIGIAASLPKTSIGKLARNDLRAVPAETRATTEQQHTNKETTP